MISLDYVGIEYRYGQTGGRHDWIALCCLGKKTMKDDALRFTVFLREYLRAAGAPPCPPRSC